MLIIQADDSEAGGDDETSKYTIAVSVITPKKVGDGVGAYMVYKVVTKVSQAVVFSVL